MIKNTTYLYFVAAAVIWSLDQTCRLFFRNLVAQRHGSGRNATLPLPCCIVLQQQCPGLLCFRVAVSRSMDPNHQVSFLCLSKPCLAKRRIFMSLFCVLAVPSCSVRKREKERERERLRLPLAGFMSRKKPRCDRSFGTFIFPRPILISARN